MTQKLSPHRSLSDKEIKLWKTLEALAGADSLLDWIKLMSPHYAKPEHLRQLVEVITRMQFEPVYAWCSVPPRFAKTETILHSVVWRLMQDPTCEIAYCTYEANLAYSKSRKMRELAERCGVQLKKGAMGVQEWQTVQGGRVMATGVGGPLTGRGAKWLIVDDALKNREEAESPIIRQKQWDWLTSTAMTRVEPGGSILINACIAEGEPVLMASGAWKYVQEVKAGDLVQSYDLSIKSYVSKRVTADRLVGVDDILELKTKYKTVRANARHPFLLASGEWKRLGDLIPGDSLVTFDSTTGSEVIDPELAWFYGFLTGDGWVTEWERKNKDKKRNKVYTSRSWCLCFAKKVQDAKNKRALAVCEKYFGLAKPTKAGYYRLDSNSVGRKIQELGLVGGAHNKRIPQWVFRLTPELKLAYLEGYSDSDGAVEKYCTNSRNISSVSSDLIRDTQLLAISTGVRHGKLKQYTNLIQAPHSSVPKECTVNVIHLNFSAPPNASEEVISIISVGQANVYDLTIDGTENFIVGGLVSHNTRWHDDDLIGRVIQEFPEWEGISMPAVYDATEATPRRSLWPSRWPLEELDKKRRLVGEFDWASLFLGQPRPKGGRMFKSATRFNTPMIMESDRPYKIIIGADPAATEKTNSDYSCAIVMAFSGEFNTLDFRGDILEVYRKQVQIPEFVARLRDLAVKWGAPICVEAVGGFKAVPQMLRNLDKKLKIIEASVMGDKFTRALPVSAAWNDNRIRVPQNADWLSDFLHEVEKFTGIKDAHDDQVDAMSHCYNSAQSLIPQVVHRTPINIKSGLPFG